MRILVVIPHYCGAVTGHIEGTQYGSQMHVLPRVAALNEMLVALHRNFGPKRYCGPQYSLAAGLSTDAVLDIVIVTMKGRNVLDLIEIEPTEYQVEYFDGEPMMLSFETQRIARERLGDYDIYAMMEDDLIIHDPWFLQNINWFQAQFGPTTVLQPQRIEVSKAGQLAKSLIEPELPEKWPEFDHPAALQVISASFNGRTQAFQLASNPHSGCWFLTAAQMQHWANQDYFYDRVPSWIGPLESAATRALAKCFTIYRASAPDPFFLEVEHYGVRFANAHAVNGVEFRHAPLLRLVTRAQQQSDRGTGTLPVDAAPSRSKYLDIFDELTALREASRQMRKTLNSRTRLTARLAQLLFSKPT